MSENEMVYYEVPEEYDYVTTKLRRLLIENNFNEWKQINLTVIEKNKGKWPFVRNSNIFDDAKEIEKILWGIISKFYKVNIYTRIHRCKKNRIYDTFFLEDRELFKNCIYDLIPYENYFCVLCTDKSENVNLALYFQAGEEINICTKKEELDYVKENLNNYAKEITCKEYEELEL